MNVSFYWKKKCSEMFRLLIVIHRNARAQHTGRRCVKIDKCAANKHTANIHRSRMDTHATNGRRTPGEMQMKKKINKKRQKESFHRTLKPRTQLWSSLCACCCLWYTPHTPCLCWCLGQILLRLRESSLRIARFSMCVSVRMWEWQKGGRQYEPILTFWALKM